MSLTDVIKDFDSLINLGQFSSMQDFYERFIKPRESTEVRDFYLNSINSPFGKAIDFFLDKKDYAKKMPDHYIYLNMPENVMAATIKISDGTTILAYNSRYADLLRKNLLYRLYVNLHEHVHVRGVISELQTDAAVENAALELTKSYTSGYTNRLLPSWQSFKERSQGYIDAVNIAIHARQRQEMLLSRS